MKRENRDGGRGVEGLALEGGHECNTASRTVEIEICNVRYTHDRSRRGGLIGYRG